MVTGIALTGVGGILFVAGSVVFATASSQECDPFCSGPDEDGQLAAAGLLVGAGVTLAAGIPLWIVGAGEVRDEGPASSGLWPVFRVGPRRLQASWQF